MKIEELIHYIETRREKLLNQTSASQFLSDETQDEIYNRVDELELLLLYFKKKEGYL